jgi:ubiquitin carboxyl-terminal hydrolase 4/11/15
MSATNWERKDVDPTSAKAKETDNVQLEDCLREFKVTESLDEDNKWYCSQCKEHVVATKTMEVFRVPPILCISLKRFRIGRSKYGFSSSGTKIDTMVDFPLEDLDMREYVLCSEQRQ